MIAKVINAFFYHSDTIIIDSEFEMSVHRICEFDPFWTDLIQNNPKIKWPFLFFLKM